MEKIKYKVTITIEDIDPEINSIGYSIKTEPELTPDVTSKNPVRY
jgi:hypothetical protein